MTSVKTAISLPRPLFQQVDTLAREMNISRSRLFVLAVEDFVRRYQNQRLLEQINAAYDDEPSAPGDQELQRHMLGLHREVIESEW